MSQPGKSFIAELRCRPERRDELIALQTELKALTLGQEPDALVYEFFQSEEDENLFMCLATFRDEAAFQHHMTIDFHDRLVPPVFDCLAEDMKIHFYKSLSA